MTPRGLRYDRYCVHRHDEWMMRMGPDGPHLLLIPPLFEEMNRTRALLSGVMRRLAGLGYGCALIDLPGTGESERPLEDVTWDDWRGAVSAAAEGAIATIALRGGCLIDDAAVVPRAWRLAPVNGASLIRDLERSGMVSGGGSAGYDPASALVEALRNASTAPRPQLRTLRLSTERGESDRKIEAPPLWRRSEPQNSNELIDIMVSDIHAWQQCAAS